MYTHRDDEYETKYGRVIAILSTVLLVLCVIFAVLIGWTHIMVAEPSSDVTDEIVVYDRSR